MDRGFVHVPAPLGVQQRSPGAGAAYSVRGQGVFGLEGFQRAAGAGSVDAVGAAVGACAYFLVFQGE